MADDWLASLHELDIQHEPEQPEDGHAWDAELAGFMDNGDHVIDDDSPDWGVELSSGGSGDEAAGVAGVEERVLAVIGGGGKVLHDTVGELAQVSRTVDDSMLDAECVKVANHLALDKEHVVNAAAEAEELGVDRKMLRRSKILTASTAVQMERYEWKYIEECFHQMVEHGNGTVKILCYMQIASYDGVDLNVKTRKRAEAH